MRMWPPGTARTSLRTAVLALSVLALVVGCSADPPPPRLQSPAAPPPAKPTAGSELVAAIDGLGLGFNPHLASDQAMATTAVAALSLPDAFRPVVDANGAPRRELDGALLVSADVTKNDPMTVTYRIQQNAQWSDGVPITGDDFRYLWEQMVTAPNVVGAEGYKLIKDVRSGDGGKQVTVEFSQNYPGWRELFADLVPAHALRDIPDGFLNGMNSSVPASGGPFTVTNVDRSRDEIRLTRNDRYWMRPATLDRLVLRRTGTAADLTTAIRSSDIEVAAVGGGPALTAQLSALPGVRVNAQPVGRVMGATFNTRTDLMMNQPVREAIIGLLDPQLLTFAGAQDAEVESASNQVFAPSDPRYQARPRESRPPEQVEGLLSEAGFRRTVAAQDNDQAGSSTTTTPSPSTSRTGPNGETVPTLPRGVAPIERDGTPMVVTVGVVSGDKVSGSVAANVVDQLSRFGIRARVSELSVADLYGSALTNKTVDMVVGWTAVGNSPATRVAARADCPNEQWATREPSPMEGSALDNISGLCDQRIYQLAQRALTSDDPSSALDEVEPLLANQAVYLPIYQDRVLTAVSPTASGVALRGPVPAGIFAGAANWGLEEK